MFLLNAQGLKKRKFKIDQENRELFAGIVD